MSNTFRTHTPFYFNAFQHPVAVAQEQKKGLSKGIDWFEIS